MAKNAYFVVVAYDIPSNRRRKKVMDTLKDFGGERVNFSVFECMLPEPRLEELKEKIENLIDGKKDKVIYYGLCEGCLKTVESIGVKAAAGLDREPGLFV